MKLDRFLHKFAKLPLSHANKLLKGKSIKVNGKLPPKKRKSHVYKVKGGDEVYVPWETIQKASYILKERKEQQKKSFLHGDKDAAGKEVALELLDEWTIYEDHDLLVLNKPSGIYSMDGPKQQGININQMLKYRKKGKESFRPVVTHRLDRDTSGAIVVAKNYLAAQRMHRWWKEFNVVKKGYWAIVHGKPTPSTGRITMRLSLKKRSIDGKQLMQHDTKGDLSITEYRRIDSLSDRFSWLSMYPMTGRKHQIRVHCSTGLEAPILGDYKYNENSLQLQRMEEFFSGRPRLYLHSRLVAIPVVDKSKTIPKHSIEYIQAPLDKDFKNLFRKLSFEEDMGDKVLESDFFQLQKKERLQKKDEHH